MILVIGKSGQLATALSRILSANNTPHRIVGSDELDLIAHLQDLAPLIKNISPTALINASGYTHVDLAEREPELAVKLNALAPAEMARISAGANLPFIHISTDYVFDGQSTTPYRPDDIKSPLNVYGRSKSEGEDAIMQIGGRSAILRTSWLYDGHGKNFLTTMRKLGASHPSIKVVDDQIGRPTYAGHLAKACITLLDHMPDSPRIFHATNSGDPISWAVFALAIFEASNLTCKVVPVPTSDYPTPAARPSYSVLDTSSFYAQNPYRFPDWREGLIAALKDSQ